MRTPPAALSARCAQLMAMSSSAWRRSWSFAPQPFSCRSSLLRTVYGPSSPYLAAALGLQLLAVAGVLDYIADVATKTLLGVQAGRLASLVNVAAVPRRRCWHSR